MTPRKWLQAIGGLLALQMISACADSHQEPAFWNAFDIPAQISDFDSTIELDPLFINIVTVRESSPAWRRCRLLLKIDAARRDRLVHHLLGQMEKDITERGFKITGRSGDPRFAILYGNENRAGHVVVRTHWKADPREPVSRVGDPPSFDFPVVELSIDFVEGRSD